MPKTNSCNSVSEREPRSCVMSVRAATACALSKSQHDVQKRGFCFGFSTTLNFDLQFDEAIARSLASVSSPVANGDDAKAPRNRVSRAHRNVKPYTRSLLDPEPYEEDVKRGKDKQESAQCSICLCDIGSASARSLPCVCVFRLCCGLFSVVLECSVSRVPRRLHRSLVRRKATMSDLQARPCTARCLVLSLFNSLS